MKSIFICLLLTSAALSWTTAKRYGFDDGRKLVTGTACYPATDHGGHWNNGYHDWSSAFPTAPYPGSGCTTSGLPAAPSAGGACTASTLISEANQARTNPKRLAAFIKAHYCGGQNGVSASDAAETINFLSNTQTYNSLPTKACFSSAANTFATQNVAAYGSSNCASISHSAGGSNGDTRLTGAGAHKIAGSCASEANSGENMVSWSQPQSCLDFIARLVIDGGLSGKGHRRSIFNQHATGIGGATKTCGTGLFGSVYLPIFWTC